MVSPSPVPARPSIPAPDAPAPRSRRLAGVAVFGVFLVELAAVAGNLAAAVARGGQIVWLPIGFVLGILLTDFISGLVHWLCDRFGSERTPLLGRFLIAPFREHHRSPGAMTHHSLLRVNHNNAIGISAVLAICLLWPASGPPSVLGQSFLLAFALAVYGTNTVHMWAHHPDPPTVARWLQRAGLALRPAHHERHHQNGVGHYCITTGWLNPALEAVGAFPRIERWLRGGPPETDPTSFDSKPGVDR